MDFVVTKEREKKRKFCCKFKKKRNQKVIYHPLIHDDSISYEHLKDTAQTAPLNKMANISFYRYRTEKKRKKNISIEMQRKSKEAVVRARALVIRTFQRQTVGQSSKHER